ncbi:hypothetical protein MRB53_042226 [Persea americana]|nr:hypothetical protein MRB53_042226 [Persea americana]
MCKTDDETFELTRISVVDWAGTIVLDELVKPENPITDYLTAYSGMTKEKLEPVTTTLSEVRQRFIGLLKPDTIIVGHSLNSDLNALKLTHPLIADSSILYPHPRGAPLKSSLKCGHDSIEDARAALDLIKQKCQKGAQWGTPEATNESIFKRIGRSNRPDGLARTGAVVDLGNPSRGAGSAAQVCIGCKTDDDVVRGVIDAAKGNAAVADLPGGGVDLVWARLRELERLRGWAIAPQPAPSAKNQNRSMAKHDPAHQN